MRLRRYGNPNHVVREHQPGPADGLCSIDSCPERHASKGYCKKHLGRYKRNGDPNIVFTKGVSRKEEVGYLGAHNRVYSLKGKAADYVCECGDTAEEWAYNHSGVQERTAPPNKNGYEFKYSLDPEQYVAMCKPCHTEFDSSELRLAQNHLKNSSKS